MKKNIIYIMLLIFTSIFFMYKDGYISPLLIYLSCLVFFQHKTIKQ